MLAIGVHGTSIRTSTTCTALLRELEVFLLLWCFRILGFEEFVGAKKMRIWGVYFIFFRDEESARDYLFMICLPFFFIFFFLSILYPMMSYFPSGQPFVCFTVSKGKAH